MANVSRETIMFAAKCSSPFLLIGPGGFWAYNKRKRALNHPIMQRALLQLKQDQRIIDFCGENVKPGYWIAVNEDPTENYIKFDFTIKGSSGNLGTNVIGDYLNHRELTILEHERQDYFTQKLKIKDEILQAENS